MDPHRVLQSDEIQQATSMSEPLEVHELKVSERLIAKRLQVQGFSQELREVKGNKTISNRAILRLYPFIDDESLFRVGGRLSYPTLRAKTSYFTTLQKACCINVVKIRTYSFGTCRRTVCFI